jgi:predicted transcriptional regulator
VSKPLLCNVATSIVAKRINRCEKNQSLRKESIVAERINRCEKNQSLRKESIVAKRINCCGKESIVAEKIIRAVGRGFIPGIRLIKSPMGFSP